MSNTSLDRDVTDFSNKMSANLICGNCSTEDHLQNLWWCADCIETACSWCAMKNHRNHDCSCWQDEKLIKETFQMLKAFSNVCHKNAVKEIDEFCCKLSQELKKRLSNFEEVGKFMTCMKRVCGSNLDPEVSSLLTSKPEIQETKKKLLQMASLLSAVDNNFSINVDHLVAAITCDVDQHFNLPAVNSVANLFFKNVKQDKNFNTAISIPVSMERLKTKEVLTNVAEIVASHDLTAQMQGTSKTTTCEIAGASNNIDELQCMATKQHPFQNPATICGIQTYGFVVLDYRGVTLFSSDLQLQKHVGWPQPPKRSSFQPSVAYHDGRKSVMIINEVKSKNGRNANKIIELTLPSLKQKALIAYPNFPEAVKRLLGVSKNGYLICATSDIIWTKILDTPNKEDFVWNRSGAQLEPFTVLTVGQIVDKTTEYFYIMGTTSVYVFRMDWTSQECTMIKIVYNLYPPLFNFINVTYAMNNVNSEFVPIIVFDHHSTRYLSVQSLGLKEKDKFLISADDKFVYLLFDDSSTLKQCVIKKSI